MQRTILRAVLVGVVAGLIVGVYHNIFTVPLIERAIALEGERAAASLPAGAQPVEEPPLVSLGAQRVGMVVGMVVLGAVFGLAFAGIYGLLRWALPDSAPPAMALIAGLLGFWALSFLVSVKFPFMPPGVGSANTLIFRQVFQLLFYILSALGVAGVILALNEINSSAAAAVTRRRLYALAALVYSGFLLLIFLLIPGNPDPVQAPAGLFLRFNNLTLIGHLLTWGLMAASFAYLLARESVSASIDGRNQR